MMPRFGPYGRIQILKAEVNRLIDLLLEEPVAGSPGWHPPVDILDGASELSVVVELPGVEADDLTVEFRHHILMIRGGKRRLESEPQARRYHLMERFIGAFQVAVEIPQPVDPAAAEAVLAQGILTVTFPRLDDRRDQPFTLTVKEERPHE